MKIAYFTDALPPLADGVSHTLTYLRKSLIKEGHEFLFFSPFVPQPDAWEGKVFEILSVPFPLYTKYKLSLPAFHDLKSKLDKFAPDIVHISSPFFLGMAAYNYARQRRIPAVNSYHTRFVSYFKYYGFGRLEFIGRNYLRWFYNQADMNFVPSMTTINELDSMGFRNLTLWERGIDTKCFSPLFADKALHEKWSPNGSPIALFAGRLVKEKDIETLIEAHKILQGRNVDYKLVFVGDGPMRNVVEKLVPDAILAGFKNGHDLSQAFATADVFVFPSTTESFGNVVLEAQASGLPSIVSNEGGVRELVKDGETGFISRGKDAVDLAQKMEILLTNELLRNSFSIRASEFASKKSWNEVNKILFEGYENIISGQSPASLSKYYQNRSVFDPERKQSFSIFNYSTYLSKRSHKI
jgi:glycosyltransferase involved in cell wall biosynthesis